MGNIKIARGVIDTKLELEHERTAKGKLMYLPARSLVTCYPLGLPLATNGTQERDARMQLNMISEVRTQRPGDWT